MKKGDAQQKLFISAIFIVLLMIIPVYAGTSSNSFGVDISQGDSVFIGESGLNIAGAVGEANKIAWYADGSTPGSDTPAAEYGLNIASNCYIDPSVFEGHTGAWYLDNSNTLAFYVENASLDIAIINSGTGSDLTDSETTVGENVTFRISGNLYQLFNRNSDSGDAGGLVINVTASDGSVLSSLSNSSGESTSLTGIRVDVSEYYLLGSYDVDVWKTNNIGSYTISVECNVNSMKDNLGSTTGTIAEHTLNVAASSGSLLADSAWPEFGYDSNHTGRSPYDGPQTAALKWGGPVYISNYIFQTSGIAIGPDGRLYVPTSNGLFALNPDGTKNWTSPFPGYASSMPAISSDETIYFGTKSNGLYAVNPDGSEKWNLPEVGYYTTSPVIGPDGIIYSTGGSTSTTLYAIYPDDCGTIKWNTPLGGKLKYCSPVIGSDGTIYIGCYDNYLYAINPDDGSVKWKYSTGGSPIYYSSPSIGSDGTIYVGCKNGVLYAINDDGSSASEKWNYPTGNTFQYASPAIGSDGTIYIGTYSGSEFLAINPDGTLKWSLSTNPYVIGPASVGSDGTIYYISHTSDNKGWLYALNPDDGSVKWYYDTSDVIYSSPTIGSDGTLYICSYQGNVYAFENVVDFTTTDGTFGSGSLTVQFNGFSSRDNASDWSWDFGDGSTSDVQNPPAHTYSSDGSYTVSLTITSGEETFTASKPAYVKVYAAPDANFNSDVALGTVPLTVNFTDNSSNSPTEWLWDFGDLGDDNTSTDQNPIHTYYSAGTYTVKLYVENPAGSNIFSNTISVSAQLVPIVNFSSSVTMGQVPLEVNFTDLSENSPFLSWEWDFGDGTNSTNQNTTHTYEVYGIYNVTLTVTNYGGNSNITKDITVGKQDEPVAAFKANKTTGMPPLSVAFTDNSTGYNITSWYWDFGEGNTSTEQNPVYTFEYEGNYSVSLNVTNDAGSNVTTSPMVVRDMLTPVVNFTADRTYGRYPTVQFTDESEFEPTSWEWDFGDSTSSTEQNPVHTYTKIGNYTVTLKATNDAGSDTVTKTDYIESSYTNAKPLPVDQCLNLYVANDEGVKYNVEDGITLEATYTFVNNTYFMLSGKSSGGVNALHITNDPSDSYGQLTKSSNASGEFWITHTGGQPNMHDGVLLLAVNGTIPDDFSVHIRSSGYDFEAPIPGIKNNNTIGPLKYVEGAVNQTFTRDDFIYGPQIWRPHRISNYPMFVGQDMSDTSNTFELMFIDLDLGVTQTIPDGYIKVEYEFSNLTTFAVFNVYGWYTASSHGTGIIMSSSGSEYQVVGVTEPPVAGFDASTLNGAVLETVQFNDTSSGAPYSWYWDFGDGTNSTEQNPEHTYTKPGVYTVNLTVVNYLGSDTKSIKIKQISGTLPEPSFTANVTSGVSPLEVNFTDTSTNSPVSWEWDFGDGTTSTEQNPVHWYAPGLYTVSLSVGNNGGNITHTEEELIVVTGNSSADRMVNSGFEIGDLRGWESDTDRAIISTDVVQEGSYSVYICKKNGYVEQSVDLTGVSEISFWGYITPRVVLLDQFEFYIDDTAVQTFPDSNPEEWTYYTADVSEYSGVHTVKFRYYSGGETIYAYLDNITLVTETSKPVAHFVAKSNTKGEYPLRVQFTDASSNYPTAWSWDFDGDGKIDSTEQSPAYTFENVGNYSVTLITKNEKGDSSSARKNYITVKGVQKLTKDVSIKNNGTLTNSSTGSKQYTVNQSEVQVSGNNIIVDSGSYTITIKSDKTPTTNGDSLVSDVTGIELETDPVEAVLDELGNVSGSVNIELNDLPEDSGLEVTIEKGNSGNGTAFQIAASSSGLNVDNVAYTMNIVKSNLTNGKEIKEARITMSVPESWVEANGGIESIKIIRIAEDGRKEVLDTTYIGTSSGIMTFEGYSPNGLSMFGLAATTEQPPATLASIPASGGGTSAIGIDSAENLKAGDTATLHFDETSIYEMDVYAKTDIPILFVTVEAGIMPEGAEAPEGDVYEYIAAFLYDTTADSVSKSTIKFGVLSDWVDSRLSSPDLLSLYYYNEDQDEWTKLSTVFDSEKNGVCYYYADSASLGYLAIVAVPDLEQVKSSSLKSEVTEQPTIAEAEKNVATATTAATAKATPLFGSMIVFVAFGLICTIAIVNRRCRKKDKK